MSDRTLAVQYEVFRSSFESWDSLFAKAAA